MLWYNIPSPAGRGPVLMGVPNLSLRGPWHFRPQCGSWPSGLPAQPFTAFCFHSWHPRHWHWTQSLESQWAVSAPLLPILTDLLWKAWTWASPRPLGPICLNTERNPFFCFFFFGLDSKIAEGSSSRSENYREAWFCAPWLSPLPQCSRLSEKV